MKVISRRTHGYLDYVVGVLLIASPWLFNFYHGGAETWVPVVLGAGAIVYSLITDYELGAARIISFKTHLTIDILSGIVLAASPWLFQFADYVKTPHLILGIMEIAVVLLTEKANAHERADGHIQHHRMATH